MTTRNDLIEAQKFIQFHTRPGDRLLCAVSGGVDSMCLLALTVRVAEAMTLRREVAAAHFNHGLRGGAADRDEAFVRDWCAAHGIPLTVGRGDVRSVAAREGLSLEEAARIMRYAFLEEAARQEGCRWILTAHHAGDNAETILMNLARGTGLKGLCGIPSVRPPFLRPFLETPREDLVAYAAARGIPHVEDETNADPAAASRNLVRLEIMPLLRQLNPRAEEHITAAARQLSAVDRALERDATERTVSAKAKEGRVVLSWQALLEAPAAVRPRMLLRLLDLLGVGRKDIGAAHLDAVLAMSRETAPNRESRVSLPHGVSARYCRGWLILETRPQPLTETQLLPGRPLRWGGYTLTLLDRREGAGVALRAGRPGERAFVTAAPCVPGERLTLPGAKGSRTVKRLCLDRRISLEERDRLPAFYVSGRLAAVWRLGVDTEFLPEGDALRFIKVETPHHEEGETS